jgi:tol-pal system protein YbgF
LLLAAALALAGASGAPAQLEQGSLGPPDTLLLPEGDAFALYDRGFGFLRRGDWAEAERAFAELLRRFPDSDVAPNARYWLAETYFQRGEHVRAARAFHEVYQEAPEAPRAADAMFKEGLALQRAGDHYGACVAHRALKRSYPLEATRYPAEILC